MLGRSLWKSSKGAVKTALREAAPWAERAAWTGYGLGMRAGLTGMAMGGQTARAAGMAGMAAGYGAYRAAGAGLKVLGMGRSPIKFSSAQIPFTNRSVPMPHLTGPAKMMLAGAGTAYGVGAGISDYVGRNRWNLSYAQSTGQVEAEREDFLGATGSLTLASYNNRNGGGGGANTAALKNAAAHHIDDFLVAGVHAIF